VGVVFFSTPHFPYVAPYPHYLLRSGDYRGPYLYHAPPASEAAVTPEDVAQIRARYDGALAAVDRATARLMGQLGSLQTDERLVLVVLGDHGEELYEEEGIAGHGDVLGAERSQSVPIFLSGPGVPAGRTSRQVRVTDLAATLLGLVGAAPPDEPFGDGQSLFTGETSRPVCVETGIWFWPDRPVGLRGRRLQYAGIAELLEMDPTTREIVLRDDRVEMVESAKRRGLVLGDRLWSEQLTPRGHEAQLVKIAGVEAQHDGVDLRALFEERCVAGDPRLTRLFGGVVYRPDDLVAER
jgi:arylsulfatase A-like enzyme